ncbi:MAG: UDP-3-O-(3-hydroxymyristoyl)glucosamine N-acyltransferase [Planctomycetota bacterium]
MRMTLHELAERVNATVVGDSDVVVTGCAPIDSAGPSDVSFLANAKYHRFLAGTQAAGVFVGRDIPCPPNVTCLVSDDPYFAFRNAIIELVGFRKHREPINVADPGISAQAAISPEATIDPTAKIHPFVTVEAGATVGARSILYPGTFVGHDAKVGEDCLLYANVSIYDRCLVGDRVIIHSSSVIGQDGFGFATHAGAHHKIPQTGITVIEDDVEIGGGCAIERAAMGETRIGAGTKMADLISIGHGTTVGKHCLFVSLVGISGSVTVGDYVVLGGQAAVAGHIKIGDGVQAMGRTAIASDIKAGQIVGGVPAVDYTTAKKNALTSMHLYEMSRRIRALERQLEKAKSASDADPSN